MNRRKMLQMLSLVLPLSIGTFAVAEKPKHVAIVAIVEHPALDQARQGIIDELKDAGYEEGKILKSNSKTHKVIVQRRRKLLKNMPAIIPM